MERNRRGEEMDKLSHQVRCAVTVSTCYLLLLSIVVFRKKNRPRKAIRDLGARTPVSTLPNVTIPFCWSTLKSHFVNDVFAEGYEELNTELIQDMPKLVADSENFFKPLGSSARISVVSSLWS